MTLVPHLMPDWNADRYHQLSSPQQTWGRKVLDRLPLDGAEHVLEIGCGTGLELLASSPRACRAAASIALDRSPAMLDTAATVAVRARAPRAARPG